MDETRIINLYNQGHSIDYIIGDLLISANRETKQWDKVNHVWHIKKPKYTRADISKFVYEVIYNEHMKIIRRGREYAK